MTSARQQASAALGRLPGLVRALPTAPDLDRLARGWRAPMLAALIAFLAGLPGLLAIPTLDRDEARFAQATSQMLETGDLVNIRFQDQPRDKKPVGIHWLQAASVSLFSAVEDRDIRAYRLPSLAGAMLAAAATAWGAATFLGPRGGLAAGGMLGLSLLLSSEAGIAKTDAVLCGAVALSMAALARIYAASRDGPPIRPRTKGWFWAGQAAGLIVKGPVAPMVALLAVLSLWAADRRIAWARRLGWSWGLVLIAAVVGPWAVAITVATDGGFWASAVGGDLAPKLVGGQESHGAPPGLHLLLSPILFFPAAFMIPAALAYGWRRRGDTFVRFALAWLIPSWLVFEAMPTKLVHYPLPVYPALAWLAAGALFAPIGPWPRRIGVALSVLTGALLAGAGFWAASAYGGTTAGLWALVAALALAGAGLAAALALARGRPATGLVVAGALALVGHAALAGGVAPSLSDLWLSKRASAALARAGLDPRNGVTPGPVAVTGYAEPSLVFALGATTEMTSPEGAAAAVGEGRPAIVERAQEPDFRDALADRGLMAEKVGEVEGFDYSNGDPAALSVWRSLVPAAGGAAIAAPRLP